MKTLLVLAVLSLPLTAAVPARAQLEQAQYYERPPPGYYPPPGYDRGPPRYGERERQFGRHCEAEMRTAYGPRPLFCRIADPKPLGFECACPPPGVGPDYPLSRYVPGRTVR